MLLSNILQKVEQSIPVSFILQILLFLIVTCSPPYFIIPFRKPLSELAKVFPLITPLPDTWIPREVGLWKPDKLLVSIKRELESSITLSLIVKSEPLR